MMNKIQQSLNKTQHALTKGHLKKSREQKPSGERKPKESGHHGPGDFPIPHQELFRRSARVLIAHLGRNYSQKFHVRELARSLDYDVSIISKNLKQLEEAGLVTHEDVGNLVFYQANMKSVLLRQLKICLTLLDLTDLIRDLDPFTTNCFLYGSCAKGEDTYESDIDLFIETPDKKAVQSILSTYQRKIARTLSPIVNTPDETYRLKTKDKILFTHIQQGIILKG